MTWPFISERPCYPTYHLQRSNQQQQIARASVAFRANDDSRIFWGQVWSVWYCSYVFWLMEETSRGPYALDCRETLRNAVIGKQVNFKVRRMCRDLFALVTIFIHVNLKRDRSKWYMTICTFGNLSGIIWSSMKFQNYDSYSRPFLCSRVSVEPPGSKTARSFTSYSFLVPKIVRLTTLLANVLSAQWRAARETSLRYSCAKASVPTPPVAAACSQLGVSWKHIMHIVQKLWMSVLLSCKIIDLKTTPVCFQP